MQAVEQKKSVPVALSKTLVAYVQTAHQQDPAQYADELRALDEMRQNCLSGSVSAEGVARLAQYYGQLVRLSSRFPVGEAGIKIAFSWFGFTGKDRKPGCARRRSPLTCSGVARARL